MQTTVTDNELDTSELDGMVQEAENQVAALQSQIKALEDENAALLKKISESSVEDAAAYRQQYNANQTRLQELKNELPSGSKNWQTTKTQNRRLPATMPWRRTTTTASRPSCRTARPPTT